MIHQWSELLIIITEQLSTCHWLDLVVNWAYLNKPLSTCSHMNILTGLPNKVGSKWGIISEDKTLFFGAVIWNFIDSWQQLLCIKQSAPHCYIADVYVHLYLPPPARTAERTPNVECQTFVRKTSLYGGYTDKFNYGAGHAFTVFYF